MNPTLLIAWFDAHARQLPWREPGTTPWGVLVSEVMLQQTPVHRVAGVWTAWLARWPAPSSLAAETPGTALRAWGKLGYPRRALRLHAAATLIATQHDDVVPADVEVLLAMPGIGAYTARAVAAFGYGRRVPVVDTNVRRVVARAMHGVAEAGPPSTSRDLSDVDGVLPETGAARFCAALMELGAVVCTAGRPRCADCPVAGECAWVRAGQAAATAPRRPSQRFAGTDRQVRGLLLDVLRAAADPVPRVRLDAVWRDVAQRDRCLGSLLIDGLVEPTVDGCYALPGERAAVPGR
ncbi:MAG: A/G-specific adenine glycosylase [Pseudonocardiales bacterium]|nr:A/G-specific adenine glycosylase [Pseudonocardiales bacterium]